MKTPILLFCLLLLTGTLSFSQAQQGIVRANGIDIAYESFGSTDDEVILLIQGTGSQLTLWPKSLCLKLASRNYRVIRFDNRDVGLSTHLDSLGAPDWASIIPKIGTCDSTVLPYTLLDMAKDAIGLMDALDIKQAHIVGASMGGAIAQLIAINYPERTLSLSLLGSTSGNPALPSGDPAILKVMTTPPPQTDDIDTLTQYAFRIYKALSSPGYSSDADLKKFARSNIKRSWYPEGTSRHVAAITMGCDRREELKNLKMPVVVIQGTKDPLVNTAAAEELAEVIPNADLVIINGMAHDLPNPLVGKLSDAILLAIESVHLQGMR